MTEWKHLWNITIQIRLEKFETEHCNVETVVKKISVNILCVPVCVCVCVCVCVYALCLFVFDSRWKKDEHNVAVLNWESGQRQPGRWLVAEKYFRNRHLNTEDATVCCNNKRRTLTNGNRSDTMTVSETVWLLWWMRSTSLPGCSGLTGIKYVVAIVQFMGGNTPPHWSCLNVFVQCKT